MEVMSFHLQDAVVANFMTDASAQAKSTILNVMEAFPLALQTGAISSDNKTSNLFSCSTKASVIPYTSQRGEMGPKSLKSLTTRSSARNQDAGGKRSGLSFPI